MVDTRGGPHTSIPEPMSLNLDALISGPIGLSLQARAQSDDLDLPMLPHSATEVLALCNGDDCDARDLALKIERDQSLAGHVLHVSNSAAYAPNEPIVSLSQAVARLGFGAICEISIAVAVKGKVFDVPGFEGTLSSLWRHSAVSGFYAKEIARVLRKNVEGAFLCGLLHEVGKPVALQLLMDAWREAGVDEPLEQALAEGVMDRFGGVLGGTLLAKWDFAPWMQAAVEYCHDLDGAGQFREQAMMTQLANRLASWTLGSSEDTAEDLARLPLVAELEIYEDDFAALLAKRENILETAEAFQ